MLTYIDLFFGGLLGVTYMSRLLFLNLLNIIYCVSRFVSLFFHNAVDAGNGKMLITTFKKKNV